MSSESPEPVPVPRPTDEPPIDPADASGNPANTRAEPIARRRIWLAALAAGLIAGGVSWFVGEAAGDFFKPVLREVQVMATVATLPDPASEASTKVRNAAL